MRVRITRKLIFVKIMRLRAIALIKNPKNGGKPARDMKLMKIKILFLRFIFKRLISLIWLI
jgi:hypothetical protein